MNQKLTLSIESNAVENGKSYAVRQGRSLSSIVEDFLLLLDSQENPEGCIPIGSKLSSLVGIGSGPTSEDDYRRHRMRRNDV